MCSFELEFIVKFCLSLLFLIKWSLENFEVHLFLFVYNFSEFS